jgi:hypothetical protein
MADEFISLKSLSENLGMDRSHARRYVLKCGIKPQKMRTLDSGNQLTLTVSRAEAEQVVKRRTEAGFLGGPKQLGDAHGSFYIVQLTPDLRPGRIKLGFAVDVDERLSQHRTAAPTAVCLKHWPCRRSWELAAIDCLTRKACLRVGAEVFDCDDLDYLCKRGDNFFGLMND